MALNGFSVLLFVSLAPEVLAKIKELSILRFAPSFSDLSFHTMPLKIGLTMTWLPHYIIFQLRKGNEMTGQMS